MLRRPKRSKNEVVVPKEEDKSLLLAHILYQMNAVHYSLILGVHLLDWLQHNLLYALEFW